MHAVALIAARGFVFGAGWQIGMSTVKATSKVTRQAASAAYGRLPRRNKAD